MSTGYEAVIGLEIHVQLATKTKMFCGCELSFGDDANTHTCPICLAHPGVLPVVNDSEQRRVVGSVRRFEIAGAYVRRLHAPMALPVKGRI